ncbi:MAG: hypothetical protein KatS3mg110_2587 [Pirellulaceae bacterium]|nr:MAG: hypothetical protein KatS3mg110_2587 [Pirellulaceae bacterium]
MNYLAHAWYHLDQPYRVAGTALPDWLSVADRRLRLRHRHVRELAAADLGSQSQIAQGVLQHWYDDGWFHQHPVFAELSSRFAWRLRQEFDGERSLRPAFLGHILVELLLDAALIEERPQNLDRYYATLETIDVAVVAEAAERMAGRPAERLAPWVRRFLAERFLYDYVDDGRLAKRLNQVLQRVGLEPLDQGLEKLLAEFRPQVRSARRQLLDDKAAHTV